ncbi:MAG: hypothetical protein R3B06_25500 [Kofleriaceae bacterium]
MRRRGAALVAAVILGMAVGGCAFEPRGVPGQGGPGNGGDVDAPSAPTIDAAVDAPPDGPPDAAIDAAPPCRVERTGSGSSAGRVGGDGGGDRSPLDCGPTQLPVGVKIWLSDNATTNGGRSAYGIALVCRDLVTDGVTPSATMTTEQAFTGSGGFGWTPATLSPATTCPVGAVMVGLAAHRGVSNSLFLDVAIDCATVDGVGGVAAASTRLSVGGSGSSSANADQVVCPTGSALVTAGIRGGAGLDSVEPRCAALRCQP